MRHELNRGKRKQLIADDAKHRSTCWRLLLRKGSLPETTSDSAYVNESFGKFWYMKILATRQSTTTIGLAVFALFFMAGCSDDSSNKIDNANGPESPVVDGQTMPGDANSDRPQLAESQLQPVARGSKPDGKFPIAPDAISINSTPGLQLPKLPDQIANYQYSSAHTPFLAFGFPGATYQSESWNLATGQKIGSIDESGLKSTQRSLAPDGTKIAFWNAQQKSIEIWSYESGKQLSNISLESFQLFLLVSSDRILVNASDRTGEETVYQLSVYDTNSGTLIRELPAVTELSEVLFLNSAQVSSTGKYVASFYPERGFKVFETDTMQQIAVLPVTVLPKSGGSCAFSHDGTKLAGVSSSADETLLFVASLSDGTVQEYPFDEPVRRAAGGDRNDYSSIEWLPDDSGWLVGGDRIVDAWTRKTMWKFELRTSTHDRSILIPGSLIRPGSNYDLVSKTGGPVFRQLKWPQDNMQSLARTLRDKMPAKLQPDDSISVDLQVATMTSGEEQNVEQALRVSIDSRLRSIGLQPTPDGAGDIVLSVQYSEAEGRLMRRNGRFLSAVARPSDTSGIRSVAASVNLTMKRKDTGEQIWSYRMTEDPMALNTGGQTSLQAIRKSVLKSLAESLETSPIPYLITESGVLPGITVEEE